VVVFQSWRGHHKEGLDSSSTRRHQRPGWLHHSNSSTPIQTLLLFLASPLLLVYILTISSTQSQPSEETPRSQEPSPSNKNPSPLQPPSHGTSAATTPMLSEVSTFINLVITLMDVHLLVLIVCSFLSSFPFPLLPHRAI
jgi:hypothetical protein